MKLLKETRSGSVVFTLKGEFDTFVTSAFTREITRVLGEGLPRIVLNMAQVTFVNSTALGAMIKVRKAARAAGGELVVAAPSATVREAMESLGLERLFPIYLDDVLALEALEGGSGIDLEGESESAVQIYAPESTRPQVARLKRLDGDGMEARLPGAAGKLVQGRQVRLKFRLPLYRKEFFELDARIERVEGAGGDTLLALRFTTMSDEDRRAIESFVSDMAELRRAARGD